MLKSHIYFLLSVFILFGITAAWLPHKTTAQQHPQRYIFRQLKVSDGLSDNRVRKLGMSNDGVLCIRTNTMIDMYNGSTFEYNRFDPEHVVYDEYIGVYDLKFDATNRMWLQNQDFIWALDMDDGKWIYDVDSIFVKMGITGKVKTIFIDKDKNYWLSTENKSVYYYNISTCTLSLIEENGDSNPRNLVQNGDNFWILYDDNSLKCWNSSILKFTFSDVIFSSEEKVERVDMLLNNNGNLVIMFNQGLFLYDTQKHIRLDAKNIVLTGSDLLTCMDLDEHSNVWLGSSKSGLRIVDGNTLEVTNIPLKLFDGQEVSNNIDISDIFIDQNGIVWIGTSKEGVLYYHKSMAKFDLVNKKTVIGPFGEENVKCLLEMEEGKLIMGTAKGVYIYDSQRNSVSSPAPFDRLKNELCTGLYKDKKGRIWLATFQNGCFCIDGYDIRHYLYGNESLVHVNYYKNTPYYNSCRTFLEDSMGNFWISVYGGVGKFDIETGEIDLISNRHSEIEHIRLVRNIVPLDSSRLLIAGDNGLFIYYPKQDSVVFDAKNQLYIGKTTKHNCLYKDSRGILWFGTHDGLQIWNEKYFTAQIINDGSEISDNILGIIEDNAGNIWLSSPGNIYRVEVTDDGTQYLFRVYSYNSDDGVSDGSFYEHSAAKGADGTIFFGGSHGVLSVHPSSIIVNTSKSTPYILDLKLFNQIINPGEEYRGRVLLQKEISKTDNLSFNYDENVITFDISGLNYINPSRTYYRYRLENYEDIWTVRCQNKAPATVTYSNLSPGDYRFIVYTANDDKLWCKKPYVINIKIDPPVWQTLWAKILYTVLAIIVIFLCSWFIHKRSKNRREQKAKEAAEIQRRELEQMKLQFFTNVSHELRTPLTLIITPVESILKKNNISEDLRRKLVTVSNNAQALLLMVNHLLDFRKLEMGKEVLNIKHGVITNYINDIFCSFKDTAESKMINFDYVYTEDIEADYDSGKILKIMNNLLSNAFKFTNKGGSVYVFVSKDGDNIKIDVRDTGIGIPSSEIQNIFTRFYQVNGDFSSNNSSGIGLHMVKEYVALLGGKIEVESVVKKGTCFTILLPVYYPDIIKKEVIKEEDQKAICNSDNYTIMLVDDNEEFRHYLAEELQDEFSVLEAIDGKKGIEIAFDNKVDLIISDVMMPIMDGIEMCKTLKTSIETSHIPIILLTAKTSDENKMTGFEAGADEYLPKPFNLEMLLLRVHGLIEQRQRRIEAYSNNIDVNPTRITITSLDEKLIQKALSCVEKNMDNPDYSVEMLSADVGMHRMNLYRKLNSILGQNPSLFIRTIRLKRAAQLLQDGQISVSEVAYMVGFNLPKYFSKYFKEMFGMTPTQYSEQYRK